MPSGAFADLADSATCARCVAMDGAHETSVLTALTPAWVNGVRVISCQRLGSTPSPLPLDPSDRRFEYTADYIFITGVT